nr:hypothetical protein [Tanacetum cinerariifolium]
MQLSHFVNKYFFSYINLVLLDPKVKEFTNVACIIQREFVIFKKVHQEIDFLFFPGLMIAYGSLAASKAIRVAETKEIDRNNQRDLHGSHSCTPQNGNSGVEKTSANGGLGEGTLKELRNYTVNEQTHDEPQPDTSSNNNMKYHQENSQELADDIADEPAAINKINNIGESHKVVSLTDTHGCPRVYDVPVQEKHRVLDYESTQQLPPTDIVESSDQYHDCSNDRSQDTHHFILSQQTLELKCAPQSPLPSPSMLLHDQYEPDGVEPELHDAFDPINPLENNEDNLSWQDVTDECASLTITRPLLGPLASLLESLKQVTHVIDITKLDINIYTLATAFVNGKLRVKEDMAYAFNELSKFKPISEALIEP